MDAINSIGSRQIRLLGDESIKKQQAGYSEMTYGLFYDENKGVNGQIDEAVFQGQEGDCWLISGILSLSYDDKGQELIKDAISKNPDGSYNVYFKGVDKSYTITKEELNSFNKLDLAYSLVNDVNLYDIVRFLIVPKTLTKESLLNLFLIVEVFKLHLLFKLSLK